MNNCIMFLFVRFICYLCVDMCDLQIKQAVNLDTQRKVILVLHYNDIELVITDSNVIKVFLYYLFLSLGI